MRLPVIKEYHAMDHGNIECRCKGHREGWVRKVKIPCMKPKLLQAISHIRAVIFFIYYWEFTDGFFLGKPNINEYFRIWTSVEVRNWTKSESLSKVYGWESLIFQINVTFSMDFPRGEVTWVNFCWVWASQRPYPIIVYSLANCRPHISHSWANM